jgi:hypothetical protein
MDAAKREEIGTWAKGPFLGKSMARELDKAINYVRLLVEDNKVLREQLGRAMIDGDEARRRVKLERRKVQDLNSQVSRFKRML